MPGQKNVDENESAFDISGAYDIGAVCCQIVLVVVIKYIYRICIGLNLKTELAAPGYVLDNEQGVVYDEDYIVDVVDNDYVICPIDYIKDLFEDGR